MEHMGAWDQNEMRKLYTSQKQRYNDSRNPKWGWWNKNAQAFLWSQGEQRNK
jgi:hypothetical protein